MSSIPSAMVLWKRLHWSFFVNTQGLLISLNRFEQAFKEDRIEAARIELHTAASMMRAAGASMQLCGTASSQEYAETVRPSMTPPNINANNFSGLMSWDHSTLIQVWKRLKPIFDDLPEHLNDAHTDFVNAYRTMAVSHSSVCAKFGGVEGGSLRYKEKPALNMLRKFLLGRQKMIDPKGRVARGCPWEEEESLK